MKKSSRLKRRLSATIFVEQIEPRYHLDAQLLSSINAYRNKPDSQIVIGSQTYFHAVDTTATSRIGVTDGTAGGTRLLSGSLQLGSNSLEMTNANGKLYFIGREPTNSSSYTALYRVSDADNSVIKLTTSALLERATDITYFNGKVYFRGYSSARGWELFETNGTAAGTRLSFELASGSASGVEHCEAVDGKLFLFRVFGWETTVYTSDGTLTGTTELGRIASPYEPQNLMHTPNGTAFVVGNELWASDGTVTGTRRVQYLEGDDSHRYRTVAWTDDFAVFSKPGNSDDLDGALWRTDGTTAGTVDLGVSFESYGGGRMVTVGDSVFVTGSTDLLRITETAVTTGFGVAGTNLIADNDDVYFGATATALGSKYLGVLDPLDTASARLFADGIDALPLHIAVDSIVFSTSSGLYIVNRFAPALPAVSGRVFNDVNADGIYQIGEPVPTTSTTAFIDLDSNGVRNSSAEPSIPIATDGTFALRWTRLGTYAISFTTSLSTYRVATTPTLWPVTVVVGSSLPNISVGYHNRNPRTGKVINDLNANDVANSGEPGAPGVTVYVDANANGSLDSGEMTTTTDASGNWTIADLFVGTYALRVLVPEGWYSTFPLSEVVTTTATVDGGAATVASFGISLTPPRNLITGRLFEDRNGNGVYNSGDAPYGGTVWNDIDGDGILDAAEPSVVTTTGTYSLYSVPGVQRLRVSPLNGDWVLASGPAPFTLAPGQRRFDTELIIQLAPATGNSIGGRVFKDANFNGFMDADETYQVLRVGIDLNGDGFLQPLEPIRQTDGMGRFRFNNLSVGVYLLRIVIPSFSFQPSAPIDAASYPVNLAAGVAIENVLLGGDRLNGLTNGPPLTINQRGFLDTNRNGVMDLGESVLSTNTCYIDMNANGVPDSYFGISEPGLSGTASTSVAPNRYRLVTSLPTGWQLTNGSETNYRQLLIFESQTIDFGMYRPRANTSVSYDRDTRIVRLQLSTAMAIGTWTGNLQIVDATGVVVAGTTFISSSVTDYRVRVPMSLPNGTYFVRAGGAVLAGTGEDPASVPSVDTPFTILRGDADGNGMVDFSDLLILSQNYGLTGRSFSQGNFNYDSAGTVNFDDLLILSQNYGLGQLSSSESKSKKRSIADNVIR